MFYVFTVLKMFFGVFNCVFLLLLKHNRTKGCIFYRQIEFIVHFLDRTSLYSSIIDFI